MKSFRSFLLGITAIAISITFTILVMMKGWGLEPQSWWWIVGVYFIGGITAQIFLHAAKEG